MEVREPISDIHIGLCDDFESRMDELTSVVGKQPRLPDLVF